jgi:hypothetical protein
MATSVYDQFTGLRSFADFNLEQQEAIHAATLRYLEREAQRRREKRPRRDDEKDEIFHVPGFDRQARITDGVGRRWGSGVQLEFWSSPSVRGSSEVGYVSMSSCLWSVVLLDEVDFFDPERDDAWYQLALEAASRREFSPARTTREAERLDDELVEKRHARNRERIRRQREQARANALDKTRATCPDCGSDGHRVKTPFENERGWQYACGASWRDQSELPIYTATRGRWADHDHENLRSKDYPNAACTEIIRLRGVIAKAQEKLDGGDLAVELADALATKVDMAAELDGTL